MFHPLDSWTPRSPKSPVKFCIWGAMHVFRLRTGGKEDFLQFIAASPAAGSTSDTSFQPLSVVPCFPQRSKHTLCKGPLSCPWALILMSHLLWPALNKASSICGPGIYSLVQSPLPLEELASLTMATRRPFTSMIKLQSC